MTLRDDYCQAARDYEQYYEEWMQARDWFSIELTGDLMKNLEYEAACQGITLADCEGWEPDA